MSRLRNSSSPSAKLAFVPPGVYRNDLEDTERECVHSGGDSRPKKGGIYLNGNGLSDET